MCRIMCQSELIADHLSVICLGTWNWGMVGGAQQSGRWTRLIEDGSRCPRRRLVVRDFALIVDRTRLLQLQSKRGKRSVSRGRTCTSLRMCSGFVEVKEEQEFVLRWFCLWWV